MNSLKVHKIHGSAMHLHRAFLCLFLGGNRVDSKQYGGVGFSGLLAIAFIVLRLLNVISWPWIWVLAPVWIPLSLCVLLIVIAAILENK
jgi:hypothetical protein